MHVHAGVYVLTWKARLVVSDDDLLFIINIVSLITDSNRGCSSRSRDLGI